MYDLGNNVFGSNRIESIPDNWGEIEKIPDGLFGYNHIKKLPDNWGKITEINNGAFSGNDIAVLPPSWNDVTYVSHWSFANNPIEKMPLSSGKVTSVGETIFGYLEGSSTRIKLKHFVFEEEDNDIERISKIFDSRTFGNEKVYIRPKSGVRPANVADTDNVKIVDGIFDGTVKIKSVDENGSDVLPPETIKYDLQKVEQWNIDNGRDIRLLRHKILKLMVRLKK